ncbi:hypothetical protein M747DRAFT_270175, partial [Aspergillus niger ATCC 13496]|uniref:Uncharacterized protein n=3 Tax=Aspergillus niger TaxID=5061 RepID=A0AAJ8BS50_ASPNG
MGNHSGVIFHPASAALHLLLRTASTYYQLALDRERKSQPSRKQSALLFCASARNSCLLAEIELQISVESGRMYETNACWDIGRETASPPYFLAGGNPVYHVITRRTRQKRPGMPGAFPLSLAGTNRTEPKGSSDRSGSFELPPAATPTS